MNQTVIEQLMALSSGTISSLTNLRDMSEIEEFQGALVSQARHWVKMGVIEIDDPWQHAWDLFKRFFDIHRHLMEVENESESSTEPAVSAKAC